MKTFELIKHFSQQTSLPVDVNEVVDVLRGAGHDDELEFIGVDLDANILQGQIKWAYGHAVPYGEPTRHVNIYYHRGHTPDYQRFICCKELLHLLDPESAHTRTREQIDVLAEKIGLPPEMQDPAADGFAANVDRLAEFRAAAILLPLACRDELINAVPEMLSIDDIARMADIPRRYAAFVMSPYWPRTHDLLIQAPGAAPD